MLKSGHDNRQSASLNDSSECRPHPPAGQPAQPDLDLVGSADKPPGYRLACGLGAPQASSIGSRLLAAALQTFRALSNPVRQLRHS